MKVILRDNIESLGKKGDIIIVASGYGRNYLIPKKLAIEVTATNMKMIEMEQQALRKRFDKELVSHREMVQRLNDISLTFVRKVTDKEMIFGSVSTADIKEALEQKGFSIDKKKILLEEPIKKLGNYVVPVKVFQDERAEIKLDVVQEGKEDLTEEKPIVEKTEPSESEEKSQDELEEKNKEE